MASAVIPIINYSGWQADLFQQYDCGIVLTSDPVESSSLLYSFLLERHVLSRVANSAHQVANEQFDSHFLTHKIAQFTLS